MRRIWNWTENQLAKLNKAIEIIDELAEYKPLTLRQIFYQFVSREYIENKQSQYGMLSKLLKHARIDGYIPWGDIEDRVRSYHDLTGWLDSSRFIKTSLNYFLTGYKRDLLQSQDIYLEIWIEKDALSAIFTRVAEEYTVPVVVCRGFSSASFLNDFKERLELKDDKKPMMLYFGDFDPSGMEMLPAMQETLENEMGVTGVEFKRIALTKQDIRRYNLPHDPRAIKANDTRTSKHVQAHGMYAVELDALRPDVLTQKIKGAIEAEIDIDLFHAETGRQEVEFNFLNSIKDNVCKVVEAGF